MAAGVRYVSMSPAIRTVLLRSAIFGAGASGLMALMPLVAKELLGGGPLDYGLMLGAFGVGAVAGAIGAARLRRVYSTETIVRWACVAFAIAAAIAGLSRYLPATMAGLLLAGAGWVLALATFNVAVQLAAPRWVVARALSLYQMAAFGGIAGGSWLWGVVAERESITFSLLACAAVLFVCAVLGAWRPLAQSEELDLDPLRNWQEPETAVPVDAQDRAGRDHHRVRHPRGRPDAVPCGDVGAQAHPPPGRRVELAAPSRPVGSRAVDRAVRDADLARLPPAQQPDDAQRCRRSRIVARTAPRPRRLPACGA